MYDHRRCTFGCLAHAFWTLGQRQRAGYILALLEVSHLPPRLEGEDHARYATLLEEHFQRVLRSERAKRHLPDEGARAAPGVLGRGSSVWGVPSRLLDVFSMRCRASEVSVTLC